MTTYENRPPMGSRRGGGRKHTSGHAQHTTTRPVEGELYSDDGRCVGWIRGDTVYKVLDGTKHMLRKPRGWAMDASALETMKARGLVGIDIEDRIAGLHYAASVATFEKYGVRIDRGFGAQVCLPLGFWSINGHPPRAKAARPPEPDEPLEPASVQLCLLPW